MLKQPPEGSRNVNKYFLETEKKRIDRLNEMLGDLELTRSEEEVLIWLCGWDSWTIENIISVMEKYRAKR